LGFLAHSLNQLGDLIQGTLKHAFTGKTEAILSQ
jgi:hypothetical protein